MKPSEYPLIVEILIEFDENLVKFITIRGADKLGYGELKYLENKFGQFKRALVAKQEGKLIPILP